VSETPPFVVSHRGGNDIASLGAAERLGIEVVEADLHLFRGRIEVRHLKTLGPIPLLWDRWALASPFRPRLVLADLLDSIGPATRLMLDLKGRNVRLSHDVLDALQTLEPRRTIVCSRSWHLLEPFSDDPATRVLHSVGSKRQLRTLLRRFPAGSLQGVSIHVRLLDGVVVEKLRERADLVFSWPVNTLARVRELAAWGVSGMISDRPHLARELAAARSYGT
jgi:glycerophosphoryl diester phosphodiesterase